MIDLTALETALTDLPLYEYIHFTTDELCFLTGSAGSASMSAPCTAKAGPAPPARERWVSAAANV